MLWSKIYTYFKQQSQPQALNLLSFASSAQSQNQQQSSANKSTDGMYASLLSQQLEPQMPQQSPESFVMTSHTAGNTKTSNNELSSMPDPPRGTFGPSQGFTQGSIPNTLLGGTGPKSTNNFWDVSNEIGGIRPAQHSSTSNAPPGSGGSATAGVIARPTPPGYQPPPPQQSPPFGSGSTDGSLPAANSQNQTSTNYPVPESQFSSSDNHITTNSQMYTRVNSSATSLASVIGVPPPSSGQQRQSSPSGFPLPPVGSLQQRSGNYFPQSSQQQTQPQATLPQKNSLTPSRPSPHVQDGSPGISKSPHYSPVSHPRQRDGSPQSTHQHRSPPFTTVKGSPHGSLTESVGAKGGGSSSLYSPPPFSLQNPTSGGPSGNHVSEHGNVGGAETREREHEHEREREQREREQRDREHRFDQQQLSLGGPHRPPQQLRFAQTTGLGRPGGISIDTSNIHHLASSTVVRNATSTGPLSPTMFSLNAGGGARDPITLTSNNPALHRALLTPITHPAPPPAPSAPPTASTPGTDYYYWPDSATTSRWRDREEDEDHGSPAPGPAPSTMTSLRGIPGSVRNGPPRGGLIGFLRGQGLNETERRVIRNGTHNSGASGINSGSVTHVTRTSERERDDDGRREPPSHQERPQSAGDDGEFDNDPIPTEYRPVRKLGEEGRVGPSGSGSSLHTQGVPPTRTHNQYVPHNIALHSNPQKSPPMPPIHLPIGYGNAQYTSKNQQTPARMTGIPPPPVSSSTTTLATSTSPQTATRESIMRGQWVGGTAAVAGPAPVSLSTGSSTTDGAPLKSSENVVKQMQERPKQLGSIGSSVLSTREQPKRMFSTDTINSQEWSHVSPVSSIGYQPPPLPPQHASMSKPNTGATSTTAGSFIRAEDILSQTLSPDKLDSTTNPSAAPSPEMFHHHHPLQHRPAHQQHQQKPQQPVQPHLHRDRSVSVDEEKLVSILKGLYKVLPDSHIRSLHNFALYLSEDALAAEKAQRLLSGKSTPRGSRGTWSSSTMAGDINDRDTSLDALANERLKRWNEWVEVEESERKRHVTALVPKKSRDIPGRDKTINSSNIHTGVNIETGRLSGGSESSSGVFVESNVSLGGRRSDGTIQSGIGDVVSSPPASAVGGKVAASETKVSPKGGICNSSLKNPFDTETDSDDEITDDDNNVRQHRSDSNEHKRNGMQPLPPPPRIMRVDESASSPASLESFLHKNSSNDRKQSTSPPLQTLHHHHPPSPGINYRYEHSNLQRDRAGTPPEAPDPPQDTPSPTPTFVQVARAPKDLELQMPRPVPSVPAYRLDPSTRNRHEDDDASVAGSEHQRPDSDAGQRGQPGTTPFYSKFSQLKQPNRPVDIKNLTSVITSFMMTGSGPDAGPDIPQFLHMASQALDTATHSPSLDTYLTDARGRLSTKSNAITENFNAETAVRKQKQTAQVDAYCKQGAVYQEVSEIEEKFAQDEAQRKIEHELQLYQVFENEYVEIAYKDVKGQLEVLSGRWYEKVKAWLLNTAAVAAANAASQQPSGTAMHYYLVLEAVDLLNKLHISMEEHEHVLQGLVSDRNQRYLQVSILPLIMQGNHAHVAEGERRFWRNEQDRGMAAREDTVRRATEHVTAVERVVSDFIKGLKCKFEEVIRETHDVIFQLPTSTLQSQLFRTFFDDMGGNKITFANYPSGENLTVPAEVISVIGDSVQTLSDIVGLVKLSLDLQSQAQIRLCEAQCSFQVLEDHRKSGATAPQLTASAVTAGLAQAMPIALKKLSEEQNNTVADVLEESMDVVRRLGALSAALRKEPGSRGSSVTAGSSKHGSQAGASVKVERVHQQSNTQSQSFPRWNEILESPLWPPSSANVVSGKDTTWAFMAAPSVQMPQMPPMAPIHYQHQQLSQDQQQQPPAPPPHQTQPQMQQHQQLHHPPSVQSPGFSLIGSLRSV